MTQIASRNRTTNESDTMYDMIFGFENDIDLTCFADRIFEKFEGTTMERVSRPSWGPIVVCVTIPSRGLGAETQATAHAYGGYRKN